MRSRPDPARHVRRRRPAVLLHLRRHPRARVLLSAVLLAAAFLVAHRSLTAAAAARADWGRTVPAVVAVDDIEAGDALSGATEVRDLPAAVVPDGALTSLDGDESARAALYAGEIVVAARVAPDGLTGVAAAVPDGHRAVAVPTQPGAAPTLSVGDLVDVLVAVDPAFSGGVPPGFAVAEAAPVIDIGDEAVTVAVPRSASPRVAFAVSQGLVTLALVGA